MSREQRKAQSERDRAREDRKAAVLDTSGLSADELERRRQERRKARRQSNKKKR